MSIKQRLLRLKTYAPLALLAVCACPAKADTFSLDANGDLWRNTGSAKVWIDGNVMKYQLLANNEFVIMGRDRKLWLESEGWRQSGRRQIDGNVLDFRAEGGDTYLVVGMDKKYWRVTHDYLTHRVLLGNNVESVPLPPEPCEPRPLRGHQQP